MSIRRCDNLTRVAQILAFWFGDKPGAPRKEWFSKSDAFDAAIRERFAGDYDAAIDSGLARWRTTATGSLAFILLLDQFPRNMFRGDARAFASDYLALNAAREAIDNGYDRHLPALQRAFVYLPFEHSEALSDQDRAVALFEAMRGEAEILGMADYAVRHRDVIARFGRFPHRNAILGRRATAEEEAFLREPGSSF